MSGVFSQCLMEWMGDEMTGARVGKKVGARAVVRKVIEQEALLGALLQISTRQREEPSPCGHRVGPVEQGSVIRVQRT
jgi:hypothetical protein